MMFKTQFIEPPMQFLQANSAFWPISHPHRNPRFSHVGPPSSEPTVAVALDTTWEQRYRSINLRKWHWKSLKVDYICHISEFSVWVISFSQYKRARRLMRLMMLYFASAYKSKWHSCLMQEVGVRSVRGHEAGWYKYPTWRRKHELYLSGLNPT